MLRYDMFKKMCGENLDQIMPYVMLVRLCVMLLLHCTFVYLEALCDSGSKARWFSMSRNVLANVPNEHSGRLYFAGLFDDIRLESLLRVAR